ncbi:MAG TPA: choloylglycine hydrolase family protein [Gemmataceae bacterium]|nr:choloylglycine hydrolase family protein [Gemmataceae bacterium]
MNRRLLTVVAGACGLLLGLSALQEARACTDFLIKSKDGAVIVGRSLEFGMVLPTQLAVHPRGEANQSDAPDGKKGLAWTSKHGYLAAESLGGAVDGLNEKGLSVGFLYLPGYAEYQDKDAAKDPENALSILALGAWLLGNFENADEVLKMVPKFHVWGQAPNEGGLPVQPLHLAVHDAGGKSLVIEWVKGRLKIYDNDHLRVMTNSPPFDWHLINITNYLNLKAASAEPIKIGGSVLTPPGQGSGFLGIPGDWTPPSRLVRTAAMMYYAKQADNATEGVNLAAHILNAVDIPKGDVRPSDNSTKESDYTQWIVVKDLTNKVLYFRTYDNPNLRVIDLKTQDLTPGAKIKSLPIQTGRGIEDVGNQLK